jgi:hypothetical protein
MDLALLEGDGLIADLPAKLSAALPSLGFCVVQAARTMQVEDAGHPFTELPAGSFQNTNAAAMKGGTLP